MLTQSLLNSLCHSRLSARVLAPHVSLLARVAARSARELRGTHRVISAQFQAISNISIRENTRIHISQHFRVLQSLQNRDPCVARYRNNTVSARPGAPACICFDPSLEQDTVEQDQPHEEVAQVLRPRGYAAEGSVNPPPG